VAARRLGREVAVANETCAVQVYGRGDAVVSIRRIAEPGRAAGGRPAAAARPARRAVAGGCGCLRSCRGASSTIVLTHSSNCMLT
jgi:hypothetical protein